MQLNFPANRKGGFTLIEILVVIAIIGLLVSMGAFMAVTQLSRGRDARRISDIKAMQSALEQRMSIEGNYTSIPPVTDCANLNTDLIEFLRGDSAFTDPRGAAYSCDVDATTFCVCATLEGERLGNASAVDCSNWTGSTHFCAMNQQ